jgi:peptidoglycan/LPS O-acetylase OafA/YrhL
VGVCLLMIVERRVVIHEQGALASAAHNPQVAQSVLGDLLHGFFVLTAWVLAMALVVLVIAVLSGPYRWAVAIRSRVTRAWRSIAGASSGDRQGQMVTWMASHAAGLQLAGAVAAGILLLIVPVWWLSFLIIAVLLAAYEIYLQRIKPPPPDEAPPASGPGNQAGLPSRIGGT